MNVFRLIAEQQAAVGSPLFAVSLVAVRCADTPVMLLLHWHRLQAAVPSLPGLTPQLRSLPGSAIQINERWQRLAQVEAAALDAAWQAGAWDLQRTIHRACNLPSSTATEATDWRRAFGDYRLDADDDREHLLDDGAPDRAELMALAARRGYTRWLFRPVAGGLWQQTADDVTLQSDWQPSAARSGEGEASRCPHAAPFAGFGGPPTDWVGARGWCAPAEPPCRAGLPRDFRS
ncbi:MAG: diguanylate cyclase [Burkholderiaceae bacterium]